MSTRLLTPCLVASLSTLLFSQPATGHIRTADLNTSRTVLEREWLEMKLELMALRLSYPAYRITLELDEENRIVFTFLASGGLAEHLSDLGPTEAKQMLAYHASGIRDRVSDLIRIEFQDLLIVVLRGLLVFLHLCVGCEMQESLHIAVVFDPGSGGFAFRGILGDNIGGCD